VHCCWCTPAAAVLSTELTHEAGIRAIAVPPLGCFANTIVLCTLIIAPPPSACSHHPLHPPSPHHHLLGSTTGIYDLAAPAYAYAEQLACALIAHLAGGLEYPAATDGTPAPTVASLADSLLQMLLNAFPALYHSQTCYCALLVQLQQEEGDTPMGQVSEWEAGQHWGHQPRQCRVIRTGKADLFMPLHPTLAVSALMNVCWQQGQVLLLSQGLSSSPAGAGMSDTLPARALGAFPPLQLKPCAVLPGGPLPPGPGLGAHQGLGHHSSRGRTSQH